MHFNSKTHQVSALAAVLLLIGGACDAEESDPKSESESDSAEEEETSGGSSSDLGDSAAAEDGPEADSGDPTTLDCENIKVGGGIGKGGVLPDFMFPDHEGEIQSLHQYCELGIALVLAAEW